MTIFNYSSQSENLLVPIERTQSQRKEKIDHRSPLLNKKKHIVYPRNKAYRYLKFRGILDRVIAFALLLALTPMLLVIGILVKITSRGPIIYTQTRLGIGGIKFKIYKFRSMEIDAESSTGAVWAKEKDPRVTLIGGILRSTHLDEFPQLMNVLKGEMALIGPRPERPEIVRELEKKIKHYGDRLTVLPGMTGLAQVTLPADSDTSSVTRKTIMDRFYIKNAKLTLDLHILFCTIMLSFGLQKKLSANSWKMLNSAESFRVA